MIENGDICQLEAEERYTSIPANDIYHGDSTMYLRYFLLDVMQLRHHAPESLHHKTALL